MDATNSSRTVSSSSSSSNTQASPVPTSSQHLAQAVLSGQAPTSTGIAGSRPLNMDMAKLATALGGGMGIPGNPIVVTISERKFF